MVDGRRTLPADFVSVGDSDAMVLIGTSLFTVLSLVSAKRDSYRTQMNVEQKILEH